MDTQEQKRVLVVDDEPEITDLLVRRLNKCGYAAFGAANGQEALAFLREHPVGLVITDVVMPIMDGFLFCREMKAYQETAHIPTIVCTAWGNMEVPFKSLGIDNFLIKPFSFEKLQAQIETAFHVPTKDKTKSKVMIVAAETKLYESIMEELCTQGALLQAEIVSDCGNLNQRVAAAQPDVIFIDMCLKHRKAVDLVRHLRQNPDFKDLIIVCFAGKDVQDSEKLLELAVKEDCRQAGVCYFIGPLCKLSFLYSLRDCGLM